MVAHVRTIQATGRQKRFPYFCRASAGPRDYGAGTLRVYRDVLLAIRRLAPLHTSFVLMDALVHSVFDGPLLFGCEMC